MAIYTSGAQRRGRRGGRHVQSAKRDIVAVLQVTAMVDLFTVLVVFLLQNYAATDQILPISEQIILPQAQQVKSLKPSHVVILSDGIVSLNEETLGRLSEKTSKDQWVYTPLKNKIVELIETSKSGGGSFILSQLRRIQAKRLEEDAKLAENAPFRVTIQADEDTSFLDIKKIMYTLTDAGVKEMNFAVIKSPDLLLQK